MKINLKALFLVIVVVVFMLSFTVYAHERHGKHNEFDETKIKISFEKGLSGFSADSQVSRWLEARIAEEQIIMTANSGEYVFVIAWPQEEFEVGGGWCNNCGCWTRHGCDSNGDCSIGHFQVCQFGGCLCVERGRSCFSSD